MKLYVKIIVCLLFFFSPVGDKKKESIVVIEFDKEHKNQSVFYRDDGRDKWYMYKVDRNPFEVYFHHISEVKREDLHGVDALIKSYKWLNNNLGGDDNLEALRSEGIFNKNYKTIIIFNKSVNTYSKVALVMSMEHSPN